MNNQEQPGIKARRQTARMLVPSAKASRTYDLCINVAGRRLFWRSPNHGVTLSEDCIVC